MLYVMSDIHGHLQRFESIMEQIKLDEGDHLFVLGDVIDRHPDGIKILITLLRMPNVTVLLGEHELMLCRAVYKPATDAAKNLWFKNGGKPTYEAWKKLSFPEQVEIIYKLQRCPLNTQIEIGGKTYLLAHGSPMELFDPATSKFSTPQMHTVWAHIGPEDKMPKGKMVIFGHTPTFIYQPNVPMAVRVGKQKIAIDCGSGLEYGGRLACLRLDDMKVFYSKESKTTIPQ